MRLVVLLSHGLGDMYPMIVVVNEYIKENNPDSIIVYNVSRYCMLANGDKDVLLQLRGKGCLSSLVYQEIISIIVSLGMRPVLCGIPGEITVDTSLCLDLRGAIDFGRLIFVTQAVPIMITTGSVVAWHRLFFNKKTIVLHLDSECRKEFCFFKKDLENANNYFINTESSDVVKEVRTAMLQYLS